MEDQTSKKKILLAEDDQFLIRTLKEKLEQEGFDVTIAFNGAQAIEIMSQKKPDILLLDLMMPIKSGFEVLEEMQKNGANQEIPVIILSNLGQESDIKRGMELGAVDYIIKAKSSMKEIAEKVHEVAKE